MKISGILISFFILIILNIAPAQEVMIIRGTITDSTTQEPVNRAIVTDKNETITTYSDENGRFIFYKEVSQPYMLNVKKVGYEHYERLITQTNNITLDVRLKKMNSEKAIKIDSIRSRNFVYGHVEEVSPLEYNSYKVVIYVLTDKWYIHPYALNKEGKGWAKIQKDGTWKIGTAFRGYQAYMVAALLVKSTYVPPSQINVYSDDHKSELLTKVNAEANTIIKAPKGI